MATTLSNTPTSVPVANAGIDGISSAASGKKWAVFGKTPIAQPSVTWPNTATATTTLNETKCNRLMAALVALGIIVTT